jgi:hypothetical protein
MSPYTLDLDKRDSTIEEHKVVYGFSDWLKSPPFIVIGGDP